MQPQSLPVHHQLRSHVNSPVSWVPVGDGSAAIYCLQDGVTLETPTKVIAADEQLWLVIISYLSTHLLTSHRG